MKHYAWSTVAVFGIIVTAIVILYVSSDDASTRDHLIGRLDSIVPFVVGAAGGALAGGVLGLARGKGVI